MCTEKKILSKNYIIIINKIIAEYGLYKKKRERERER
jgi:hypothetical protein